MSALETRIPPPIVMLVVAALMLAADSLLPPTPFSGPVRAIAAAILLILALLAGVPAVRAFMRAGTTINPVAVERASTLVTTGIYGVSRNPMYLAMALLLLSLAAWLGQPALLAGPIGFVLFINRFQIEPEERTMAKLFGESYQTYKTRVRRWI